MTDQGQDRRAPGWKRDPSGRFAGRYWDGERWTEHVMDANRVPGIDPVPEPPRSPVPPAPPVARRPEPAPTPVESRPARVLPTDPSKQRRVPLWAKIAIPVVVVVALAAAAGSDDPGSDVQVTGPSPTVAEGGAPPPAPAGDRAVGSTAKTGDFDVTVFGFRDPQPAQSRFDEPKPGHHFVSVDVQVANNGTRQQRFSSLLGFSLLDGENRKYDAEFMSSLTPGPPEGEIPPGEALRGFVVFEVPDGSTGLRFRVQGSLTAAGAFFRLG